MFHQALGQLKIMNYYLKMKKVNNRQGKNETFRASVLKKQRLPLLFDKYLKQGNDTVLVWPFKVCILEGGQSREEDKKEEILFNEILAQDEIT